MNPAGRAEDVRALFEQARTGSRRALARLITLVERGGTAADAVDSLTFPSAGHAHIVGITGAPGVGKSTLTGRLASALVERGRTVGVLAVDPSSPLTGGAILGDRVRMHPAARSASVYIRSLATRGGTGGLSLAVPGAMRILDAAGFDVVLIETVGVGQSEIAIAAAADTTVVVIAPGWGDAIQANKAGLLEVADVFVVNKADQPGAADAVRDLERMLDLGPERGPQRARPPVVCTTATSGAGIDRVVAALAEHDRFLDAGERAHRRKTAAHAETRTRALAALATRLDEAMASRDGDQILGDVRDRVTPPWLAARRLTELITGPHVHPEAAPHP